jgi:hypothetical protein
MEKKLHGHLGVLVSVWVRNLTKDHDALYTLQFEDFPVNISLQPARTSSADLISCSNKENRLGSGSVAYAAGPFSHPRLTCKEQPN